MWSLLLLLMSLIAVLKTEELIQGGKTHQNSQYEHKGVTYGSNRAIDGNLETCAHTLKQSTSWWNIDLLGLYEISEIIIYDVDQPNFDMSDSFIYIGNSTETNGLANSRCTKITNFNKGKKNTFKCDEGSMLGRYVTIYSKGNRVLILCEVWINGTRKADPGLMLIKENKTWVDALSYCRTLNMHLAYISDIEVQAKAAFESTQSNSPFVWLGLRYTCTLDFWFWINGHSLDYTNWSTHTEKECDMSAAMETTGDHLWYSKPDNETFNFFCTE
uniref:C-type lectin domain-containing protein n=1 Tax=Anabas testudineus TaxID=64144 RepID=A0AAQ6ISH4_ANATE